MENRLNSLLNLNFPNNIQRKDEAKKASSFYIKSTNQIGSCKLLLLTAQQGKQKPFFCLFPFSQILQCRQQEQKVYHRTDTYIVARMNMSSSLAVKNVACKNKLTVCSFSAKSFRFRITAILCRTHTFL